MLPIRNDQVVTFDVDDTLIMWDHPEPDLAIGSSYVKINRQHVNEVMKFHSRGQYVIVWSAGGSEWAERVVRMLGLEAYVDITMAKPRWYFDDKDASEWMERCYREMK